MNNNNYTITVYPPETDIQLWSVWCKELELGASGESENEVFYNLVENLPAFFEIKNEIDRINKLRKHTLRHSCNSKNKTDICHSELVSESQP